jgi:hypothetical protein
MDDAVGERDGHRRIRGEYVDSRTALYSTPGQQASRACFDLEFRIALRRRFGHAGGCDMLQERKTGTIRLSLTTPVS